VNPFDASTTSTATRPRKYTDWNDRPSAAAYQYYADPEYWDQPVTKASALRDRAEAQAISMSNR
jgi:hypothetical protein